MSPSEIKRLQQILARLAKKRAVHQRRLSELDIPPLDKSNLARVKILRLEIQRIEREIHMHEREIERLRRLGEGA